MYVDQNVISSAAQLIYDGISEIAEPFADDEADHRGFDEDEASALKAVLDEVTWADLCEAVRLAARRVNARPDEDDAESDEPAEDDVR